MMPTSISDEETLDLSPAQAPVGPLPVMTVPEPKSLSHARKMADVLFGPFSRIWVRQPPQANPIAVAFQMAVQAPVTYEVGTERNGRKKIYGIDENLQVALQKAVNTVSELEHSRGSLPKDVVPAFSNIKKPVLSRRAKWLMEYVDSYGERATLFGLERHGPSDEDREEIKALITALPMNAVKDFQPPTISTPEQVTAYIASLRTAVSM